MQCTYWYDNPKKRCQKNALAGSYRCPIHPPPMLIFSGYHSIDALRSKLNNIEMDESVELVSIVNVSDPDTGSPLSEARFKPSESGRHLAELILVEVKNENRKNLIKVEQIQSGKELLFESSVLIKNERTKVLAFRDISGIDISS